MAEKTVATSSQQTRTPSREETRSQKISAELNHGVLTLNLPKAEEAKPRNVKVA